MSEVLKKEPGPVPGRLDWFHKLLGNDVEFRAIDGEWITLGHTAYCIPPLNFKALRTLDAEIASISTMSAGGLPSPSQFDAIMRVVHRAALRNYPGLPEDEIAEGLDFGNMTNAIGAVLKVSGFKERAPGEPQAASQ